MSFAPDIRNIKADRALVAGYAKFAPARRGAPSGRRRLAGWVLMDAVRKACADGHVNRSQVVREVRTTNLPSPLGGRLRFTPQGEPAE